MNYKIIFDRFLKKEGVYDLFYKYYNDTPGKRYRSSILNPFENYWNKNNAKYFLSRAFCWKDSPIPVTLHWANLCTKWRKIVEDKDKKYFQYSINKKIKVL